MPRQQVKPVNRKLVLKALQEPGPSEGALRLNLY
jgi:hypothetical protein